MALVIKALFGSLGHAIGSHPFLFISLSLVAFAISLLGPILRFDMKVNIKSGFTSSDSASLREIEAHQQFFNDSGEPWYMAIFGVAQHGGSVLELVSSDEVTEFYKYITQDMPVTVVGNRSVHYNPDLCDPFCQFNSQLWNLLNYQSFFKLKYPLSTAGPYKVNIGKYLFNRTTDANGFITSVGTVTIYFTTFIDEQQKAERLKMFEEATLKYATKHNANPNSTIHFVVHGAHTVNKEVRRGVRLVAPFFIAGSALLMLFVPACYVFDSLLEGRMHGSRLLLASAAIISPLLAATTALGFVLLVGYHLNVLLLVSPFLTLAIGIGVDDAFLLTNTWMRQRGTSFTHSLSAAERLQAVFEAIGASMSITSLTNCLSFGLGCIAPAFEIRIFCAAVALSMLIDLLYQLFLYSPLLALTQNYEPRVAYKPVKDLEQMNAIEKFNSCITSFTKCYSNSVASHWARLLLPIVLIGYWLLAFSSASNLETNIDATMLLPTDSQSVDGIRIMNEIVWPDYLSINYIIRKPPNFSDPVDYHKFKKMVKSLESANNSLGSAATMCWIKDYLRYLANPSASKLDVFFGITGSEVNETAQKTQGLDMSQFDMFIGTEPYDAWTDGVRYRRTEQNRRVLEKRSITVEEKKRQNSLATLILIIASSEFLTPQLLLTVITSMLLMIGYKGVKSLADKAQLIKMCREAAINYTEYDMIPFDTDAELVDVILAVPGVTIRTLLFTIASTGLVYLLFSWNIFASVIVTLSVASICIGVVGALQLWGCYLDPLTMVALVISAGLGVDYVTHITHHYFMNDDDKYGSQAERAEAGFHVCALSMLQAGLSTIFVVFPVLFSSVGIYTVIAKAVFVVVLIGLIHGLLFVPILLASLPRCFFNSN